jgi:hypothetical protein
MRDTVGDTVVLSHALASKPSVRLSDANRVAPQARLAGRAARRNAYIPLRGNQPAIC